MAINTTADVELLFGVLGGGSVSGQSGTLIRTQLNQIVGELNQSQGTNERRIRITLDQANTKAALLKSLNSLVRTIDGQNRFKLKVSEINATSAIEKLRAQLNSMLRTLKVDTGFTVNMGPNGATSAVKKVDEDARSALLSIIEVEGHLKEINTINSTQTSKYRQISKLGVGTEEDLAQLNKIKDKYVELQTVISKIKGNKSNVYAQDIDDVVRLRTELERLLDAELKRRVPPKVTTPEETARLSQAYTLLNNITKAQENWTAAKKHDATSSHYDALDTYKNDLTALIDKYNSGQISAKDFNIELAKLNVHFKESSAVIKENGNAHKTLFERMDSLAKKFSMWFSSTQIVMQLIRALRKMVTAITEIDTAMTELKKVTDESETTYIKFLDRATDRAKQFGATISDTVKASADFARLGYDIDDASKLADAAIVYKNVGDGIENIDQASSSIISTMKAFGVEANNVMTIVDKFNIVGNNFAISSTGVGDALLNSAAALNAAGNTLDESIALITAANEVIQNPEKVGTAMKTLSMYIRAAKTEAEEAGISTDGMADSVSELRGEILALTGNKVDIMIDDNTYKSTVQIVRELAAVWDDLSDTTRTNITELIGGGVRNANVIATLISNFETVEEVLETSANSTGSALAENEKYLDSIKGKVAEFKATFEELSMNLIGSDFIKDVVSLGTTLLNVLNVIAGVVDAVGGLHTVLAATIGIIAVKNIHSIFDWFKNGIITIINLTKVSKAYNTVAGPFVSNTQRMNAALSAVGVSASMAQIAIGALVAAITIGIAIYQKHQQKLEEQRRVAAEAAEGFKEAASSIEEYKKQLEELRNAIDSGNLSEEEAYNKRQELLSIQNSLIDTYGKEAAGIDLVTGSLERQKDILDELSREKWKEFKQSNTAAINEAIELFSNDKFAYSDWFTNLSSNGLFNIHAPTIHMLDKTAEYFGKVIDYDAFYADLERELINAGIGYKPYDGSVLSGGSHPHELDIDNIYDALDVYRKLYDVTEKVGKYYFGSDFIDFKGAADGFAALEQYSEIIGNIESKIKESESVFNTYVEGLLLYDTEFSSKWGQVLAAQKQYNDALLGDDEEALEKSVSAMGVAQAAVLDAGWTNEAINIYVKEFFDKWNAETAKYDFEIKIKAKLDNDSLFRSGVEGNLSILAGDDGITDVYEVKNANPSINPNATQEQIYAFQRLNTIAETYGMTIDDLCVVLVEYGLLQDSTALVTNKAATGVEAATKALAAQNNELKEVEDIISKIGIGNIDELTEGDFAKIIEVFPETQVYLEEYAKAIAAATDENDEIAAQVRLFDRLGSVTRAFKSEKVANGLKDVADALNTYGVDSYQAQAAVLALGQYSPTLVSALYDQETGLLKVGEAAEYTVAALLALANVDLAKSIVRVNKRLDNLRGVVGDVIDPREGQALAQLEREAAALEEEKQLYVDAFSFSVGSGGGGGGSTPADKIKESFDSLNSSIEHSIFLQGQYYEEAEKSLDSAGMRAALLKQVEYYKQIQVEAHKAAERLRAYFRSQGLSADQIEMQSEIQELSQTWWDAADSIEEACQSIYDDVVKAFSDSVDEIQSVYKTLHDAADEYAKSGYITVDSLQSIIDMGVEYLALLQDENGQLVINEESINKIIKARTEQMAIESALSYVEALRIAKNEDNIAELNRLLYATNEVTGATWGLVYASLGLLGLEGDQYNAALRNINSLRALANSAVQSVGQVAADTMNTLKDMQSGVDDILKYVMDMIQHGIEQQIEDLEKLKEDYAELIELKKESLQATKDETDYQDEVAEKIKEIARLQERIDLLDLDGSRDANAQKVKLQEEMAALQKELADRQSEYALDNQLESLDKMQEAYEDQKDEEIKALEQSISSQQKLYDEALKYIEANWSSLKDKLIDWNYEYGSVLESEIVSAWDKAYAAANKYGDYVSALKQLPVDVEAAGSSGANTSLGNSFTDFDISSSNNDIVRAIVGRMMSNAEAWHSASGSQRGALEKANEDYKVQLRSLGIEVEKRNGVWYLPDGRKLFDVYGVYHTGGIVGGGSIKENEVLAKLERGEVMISNQNKNTLFSLISFMEKLGKSLGTASIQSAVRPLIKSAQPDLSSVTNNRSDSISFGDVYIYGANDETVEKHREINRRFTNEILKHLNIKK